jgi:8-oxo-dGTP pyrophosphatase MutT (NUDIX family)
MTPAQGVTPIRSGVMMMCYGDDEDFKMVFIQRTEDTGVHSGQMAFPGGRFDPLAGDENTSDTALRETYEETGYKLSTENIITALSPLYVPPSNFMIDPYIARIKENPVFLPNTEEVAQIFHIPVHHLMDDNCVIISEFKTMYGIVKAPCYQWNQVKIWGATAIILSEFICLENIRRNQKDLMMNDKMSNVKS